MMPLELIARDGHLTASPGAPVPALKISGLTVSYGSKPALFSVSAAMPEASMTAIVGPNGAGKSTLLKAALGIVKPLAGKTEVFGLPMERARGRIAYVPQRASVDWDFPASAMDVVLMGMQKELGLLGRVRRHHREQALGCLARMGMEKFADRQIGQLSGGQQQRVFLARALAQKADLYLLDEPFAGVDAATERAIIEVLKSKRAEGKTVVAVHHDLATVTDYFDHVMIVNLRAIAEGPVETAFTSDALQAAYGGLLATAQIDRLGQVAGQ
ncbi:MAG: metal ABC transporter ATP-binding protein [Pseudomonadota bacterium]